MLLSRADEHHRHRGGLLGHGRHLQVVTAHARLAADQLMREAAKDDAAKHEPGIRRARGEVSEAASAAMLMPFIVSPRAPDPPEWSRQVAALSGGPLRRPN
jgi:hypothetical protein